MTFEEMHIQMDVHMDKTTMGWLDPVQKDVYLNLALEDWPNWLYEDGFEKTARRRRELADLVRHKVYNNTKLLDKAQTPKLRYIVGIRGEFWFYTIDENDNPVEKKDFVPVTPMGHDELGVAYVDPHRTPTDCFPFYTEWKNEDISLIEIHSDNVPVSIELAYLEDFGIINGLENPTGTIALPDSVCRKIVQLAAVKAQGGTMDPRREASNAELNRSA